MAEDQQPEHDQRGAHRRAAVPALPAVPNAAPARSAVEPSPSRRPPWACLAAPGDTRGSPGFLSPFSHLAAMSRYFGAGGTEFGVDDGVGTALTQGDEADLGERARGLVVA